jgi:hypothetical protein
MLVYVALNSYGPYYKGPLPHIFCLTISPWHFQNYFLEIMTLIGEMRDLSLLTTPLFSSAGHPISSKSHKSRSNVLLRRRVQHWALRVGNEVFELSRTEPTSIFGQFLGKTSTKRVEKAEPRRWSFNRWKKHFIQFEEYKVGQTNESNQRIETLGTANKFISIYISVKLTFYPQEIYCG